MKKIIFILTFFLIIYIPYIVGAQNGINIIDDIDYPKGYDIESIIEDTKKGEMPITFSYVTDKVASLFIGGIKENIPNIIKMMAVSILSGLVINLSKEKNEMATTAAVAIAATIALKTFTYAVALANETIDGLFLFISSLMTPLATVMTAGGVAMGGATAATFVAMQVFINICKTLLLPLVCVITAFSVSDKIGKTPYLKGVSAILKQILKWGTGFMITVYSVVVGLQAQAASGFDSLAGKSIKYAVGSFVPVVGGALSDSLETVIAGAKTMAGALGIAGVIGVGYICIVPLINVCVVSLSFKLVAAIASVASEKRVSEVIDEFSQNIGRVSLILLSVAVMFILSLAMLCGFGR